MHFRNIDTRVEKATRRGRADSDCHCPIVWCSKIGFGL
jgi:hypothetical protein